MDNEKENKMMIDELRNFVITTAQEASYNVINRTYEIPESYIYSMISAARIVLEYDKTDSECKE